MAEKSNDPVAVWRKMFDDMERAFGAFALRAMTPPHFARPPGATAEAGRAGNSEVEARPGTGSGDLTERLDSIDAQLHEIKVLLHEMRPKPAKPRPQRPKSAPGEEK
jgi:hypothetical protein